MPAKRRPIDPIRKQLKARAKDIAQQSPFDDPFHGMGDFVPRDTRVHAIARVIAKLEGMRIPKPKPAPKPKPVKKAAKKKKPMKPKKGKPVAKANEVYIKSPSGDAQWLPLVPSIAELLAEGWEIVDGDVPVEQAYEFLGATA